MRRLLLLVLAVAAIGLGGATWLWRGPGPLPRQTSVAIPEGATLAVAARELRRAGAIPSIELFRRLARLFGSSDPIRAGEFAIPAGASPARILDLLQHGRPLLHLLTVPEGMPSVLVHDKLAAAAGLIGPAPTPAEGSVLPDSYAYQPGETRAAVAARMTRAMDTQLARLWQARAPGLIVTSPREALILASIVEKETAIAAERTTVAAVYANRLRLGMPLQADPTVIYPITKGRPLGRRIRESELHARNGYNTYAMAGLPAGPICNPGRASLAAVLHPAPSKALYFVANGKGGHVFADTLAEHNANVAKWFAIRRARGEM
ncbi:endolytic transglycosylase MltG [Sphingomonas morindae]|uniref:Endolytic murein transglycosylase n=1 Tax=Sphingomonas morindae TaxID=1541170 RepID=A0ABY4XAV8_9SPHN|nr:endolytic transglycosylase MltG [Sphingomonas morindae]USI73998.1 endolytic transglycosylase MltG [Sphingomonas morindae]